MSDTDRREVLKSTGFHRLRMQAFFSMSILYLFYYFCKYNLGTAAKGIQDEFGYSSRDFGMVTTVFTLVYAAGQFVNGFLGDRYGPKRIMLIGAVGAVVANVCFGLSGVLWLFILF